MPDKTKLKKHTLLLRAGDWDYLEDVYGRQLTPVSAVIRTLVSNYVDGLKKLEDAEPPTVEVKL